MRATISVSVAAALICVATWLLVLQYIGSIPWLLAIVVAVFLALVIYYMGKWQEVEFRSLRLKLREVEQIRDDVYAKAETVRAIAEQLGTMASYMASRAGRLGDEESHLAGMSEARRSIERLVAVAGIDATKAAAMMHPIDEMDLHDRFSELREWIYERAKARRSEHPDSVPTTEDISERVGVTAKDHDRVRLVAYLREIGLYDQECEPLLDAVDAASKRSEQSRTSTLPTS